MRPQSWLHLKLESSTHHQKSVKLKGPPRVERREKLLHRSLLPCNSSLFALWCARVMKKSISSNSPLHHSLLTGSRWSLVRLAGQLVTWSLSHLLTNSLTISLTYSFCFSCLSPFAFRLPPSAFRLSSPSALLAAPRRICKL